MTTKEKAQRYDEIIERARKEYKDHEAFKGFREMLERIFRELKEDENEDERIRKWLVEMVEELRKANPTNAEHNGMCSEAFAWLKKHGEQKLDDNVGPKFHEGDWVVFNNRPEGSIYQVEKIENYEYILRHFLGGSMPLSFSHENMIRLWTVEDIMEGDVLAHDDGTLTIFGYRLRGFDSGLYMAHVVLRYKIESKQACAIANVHPATKEERDILFAKLKEAGYEWDNKKKEPKKIEQKLIELGGNESKQKQDTGIQIDPSEDINDKGGNGCCLKNTVQSSTWTKEDEKMLSNIVDCIKNLPIFYESLNINGEDKTTEQFICDAINWLKSIEGRVQPKQEWSEEDLYRIEHALFGTYAVDFATRLLNKIKSLNSQNTWRPSDKQIEEFKDLLDDINWEGEILVSLYNDLKKLREE